MRVSVSRMFNKSSINATYHFICKKTPFSSLYALAANPWAGNPQSVPPRDLFGDGICISVVDLTFHPRDPVRQMPLHWYLLRFYMQQQPISSVLQ